MIYFLARKHPDPAPAGFVIAGNMPHFIAFIGIVIAFNVPSNFFLWLFVAALGLIIGWGILEWDRLGE